MNPGTQSAESEDADNGVSSSIAQFSDKHVTQVRLPHFWQNDPELWFAQVEARFHTLKINTDNERYYIVLASLDDPNVLCQVSDIIRKPPEHDKYLVLKEKLTTRFTESKEKQLHKLLTELDLRDKKPSQLLREMLNIAPAGMTEDVMRSLWMQRMPLCVKCVLSATSDVKLAKLAEIADRILEHSSSAQTFSITDQVAAVSDNRDNIVERLKEIERKLLDITNKMQKLTSRTFNRGRSRSTTPSRKEICFYHRRFGQKATKCRAPCSFAPIGGN